MGTPACGRLVLCVLVTWMSGQAAEGGTITLTGPNADTGPFGGCTLTELSKRSAVKPQYWLGFSTTS